MSFAANLVAGDANGTEDVFVRSRCTQPATTNLASVSTGGAQANGLVASQGGDDEEIARYVVPLP